jgi:hypothetical protein
MKFSQLLYYRERDTHKGAKQLIFNFYFFCGENPLKSPHENIHGEASILKKIKKKN